MEFRLTYEGELISRGPPPHVHAIRKKFHKQLKRLWDEHPVLKRGHSTSPVICPPMKEPICQDGFNWLPIVTRENGLVCGLDILMLRKGVSDHRKTYFFGLSPTGHRSRQPRLWRGIGGNGSVQRLNRPQIEHRQRVGERRGAGELIVPPP